MVVEGIVSHLNCESIIDGSLGLCTKLVSGCRMLFSVIRIKFLVIFVRFFMI